MKCILVILALTFTAAVSQADCSGALNAVSSVLENITDLATSCPGADANTKHKYRELAGENFALLDRAAALCKEYCSSILPDAVQFCSEVEADAPRMARQLDAKCR